jgi:hypothetical protein
MPGDNSRIGVVSAARTVTYDETELTRQRLVGEGAKAQEEDARESRKAGGQSMSDHYFNPPFSFIAWSFLKAQGGG